MLVAFEAMTVNQRREMQLYIDCGGAQQTPQVSGKFIVIDEGRDGIHPAMTAVCHCDRLDGHLAFGCPTQQAPMEGTYLISRCGGTFSEQYQALPPFQHRSHLLTGILPAGLAPAQEQGAGTVRQPAQQRPLAYLGLGNETYRCLGAEQDDIQP